MEKYKTLFLITGLLCFVFGFSSLLMALVGVDWVFFQMLSKANPLIAVITKLFIIVAGFVLIAMGRTDWEREREESGNND